MSRKSAESSAQKAASTQKAGNNLIVYAVIFIAGFLSGIAFSVYKTGGDQSTNIASEQAQQPQHDQQTDQAIMNLEAEVTANPDNFESWVRLGNLYFDSNQPEKAVPAYEKSLELHSGNANVYTDLGVMYRRTNQPEKAIEAFNTAIEMDPSHTTSRFNKGIVLFYDLSDGPGAIASWESILKIDPAAQLGDGENLQTFIDRMKAQITQKQE